MRRRILIFTVTVHSMMSQNVRNTNSDITTTSDQSQVSDLGGQQQAAIIVSITAQAGVQRSYSAQLILHCSSSPPTQPLNI